MPTAGGRPVPLHGDRSTGRLKCPREVVAGSPQSSDPRESKREATMPSMTQTWESSPTNFHNTLLVTGHPHSLGEAGAGHREMRIVGIMLEPSTLIVEKEKNDKAWF